MSKKINIIFDVSGSFAEDGKDSLQVNLLMTLFSATSKPDFLNEELEIAFLEWGEAIYDIDLDDLYYNYTANCMNFGGRANVEALMEYIVAVEPKSRFLLLSDGVFSPGEIKAFKTVLQKKEAVLVPIAVGPDADNGLLEEIAHPGKICCKPENIITALYDICFRSYEPNGVDAVGSASIGSRSAGTNKPRRFRR